MESITLSWEEAEHFSDCGVRCRVAPRETDARSLLRPLEYQALPRMQDLVGWTRKNDIFLRCIGGCLVKRELQLHRRDSHSYSPG